LDTTDSRRGVFVHRRLAGKASYLFGWAALRPEGGVDMERVNFGAEVGGTLAAAGSSAAAPSYRFRFHGSGNAFFMLVLKNLLLTLVTCGLYAPWAKTERRKFMWQNTEFHGQRLVWRGTGQELFIGYVKVALGYALFVGLPALVQRYWPIVGIVVQGVALAAIVSVIPFAVYWSRAYLLSRTSWRGVSFALEPGAKPFAKAFILGYLLTLLTLGFYAPIWLNRLYTISMGRTFFGDARFRYDGRDTDVWRLAMKGFFLSILTLGVYYFWYAAALTRYRAEHTYFGNARARCSLQGGELFRMGLIYIFGTTLSLGLAFPWIVCHLMQTVLSKLTFEGDIEFAKVGPADARGSAVADTLADAMDLGLSI
jgi:uncharacterized membrane protein YjgN (DUF898 family)